MADTTPQDRARAVDWARGWLAARPGHEPCLVLLDLDKRLREAEAVIVQLKTIADAAAKSSGAEIAALKGQLAAEETAYARQIAELEGAATAAHQRALRAAEAYETRIADLQKQLYAARGEIVGWRRRALMLERVERIRRSA